MVRTTVNKEPTDVKVTIFLPFCSFEGLIISRDAPIHINIVAMEIIIKDIIGTPFLHFENGSFSTMRPQKGNKR